MSYKYRLPMLCSVLDVAKRACARRALRRSLRFWERELAEALKCADPVHARVLAREQYDAIRSCFV